MPPRPLELRPYRFFVYGVFGALCGFMFFVLLRSVIGDLYGHSPAAPPAQTPTACLDDVDRLYGEISARAVAPAPRGFDSDALAREWDLWSRRWEGEVATVTQRCQLDDAKDPALVQLGSALEALEELRRNLARSGEEEASATRRVHDALASARELLKLR